MKKKIKIPVIWTWIISILFTFEANAARGDWEELSSYGQTWKYTMNTPDTNWYTPGFDDSKWETGTPYFGWNCDSCDIWIRRTFTLGTLTQEQKNGVCFRVRNSDQAQAYLNGYFVSLGSWSWNGFVPISQDAKNTLQTNNVIAAHCHNNSGGPFIDISIGYVLSLDTVNRETLLRPYLNSIRQIVFTKHYDMGGAGYFETEALSDAEFDFERNFQPGSSLCLLTIDDSLKFKETTLLNSPDGVIRDPDVSYDATRILFSWKKSYTDDYHLYEMNVSDKSIRQLTTGIGFADYEPAYIPNDNIIFTSTRCVQTVDCWYPAVGNLYLCDKNGNYMHRIGFDQVNTLYPKVMPDGTITYTRWEYNDRGQIFSQSLFSMNPDGTRQTEYYGNNSWFPTNILHARGIPGTSKVMATLSGHHTLQKGKLAIIDPNLGREETSGVTLIAPVRTPTDDTIDVWGQDGTQFQYPYPIDENNFLVAFHQIFSNYFTICFMNADGSYVNLASDPTISCNQPVPLIPREKPAMLASKVDYRKKTGIFTLDNIYYGPGLQGVTKGSIKKIRIVSLVYRASGRIGQNINGHDLYSMDAYVLTPAGLSNTSWDPKIVLGEADVYSDGSAAFEVPARTPVFFQAIDTSGHVAATMRSWSTLQPGETFSCSGCHEAKNAAPPVIPMTIASQKGPQQLHPFYDVSSTEGFSYRKVIQPILDNKCVACHNGNQNGIDLRGTDFWDNGAKRNWCASYVSLVNNPLYIGQNFAATKYCNWISVQSQPPMLPPYTGGACKSLLLTTILQPSYKGHEQLNLTREEIDKIACWIDLLVPGCGDYTEGMTDSDKVIYMSMLNKRRTQEILDSTSIADYIKEVSTAIVEPSSNNKRIIAKAEEASLKPTNRPESSPLRDGDNRVAALNDMKAQNTFELFAFADNTVMTNIKTGESRVVTQLKQENIAEKESDSSAGVKVAKASEEKKNEAQSIRETNDTQRSGLKITSVRASSFRGKNVPSRTIDNDYKTWWTPGSGGNQWITYDLGTIKPVLSCSIVTYQRSKKPVEFTIETSVDNRTFTTVYHGRFQKSESDNSCQFSECKARYVRIAINSFRNSKDLNIYEVALGWDKEKLLQSSNWFQ